MRGLTDPQNFSLDFGKGLLHHSEGSTAHGREQECGQRVEPLACFDPANDAEAHSMTAGPKGIWLRYSGGNNGGLGGSSCYSCATNFLKNLRMLGF